MQSQILLNWDVSWLLQETARFLQGATYVRDFLEINPPLIFYVYSPVIWLSQYLSINIIFALRIYIFLLATFSLMISSLLAKKIFYSSSASSKIVTLFTLTLTSIFLILPVYEFGQRDHLIFMFVLPYILLMALRLPPTSAAIPLLPACALGLLAGIGFALKPYAFITLMFIESYFIISIFKQKHLSLITRCKLYFRPEIIVIGFVFITYLLSIFYFQPQYIEIIFPFIARFYYSGMFFSTEQILFFQPAVFCEAIFVMYFLLAYSSPNKNTSLSSSEKNLCTLLCISLLGFFLMYFIPHTLWYYHVIPAYSIAILLSVLLFLQLLKQPFISRDTYVILLGVSLIIFILQPLIFFLCFIFLFCGLFLQHTRALLLLIISMALFIFPVYYTYFLYQVALTNKENQQPVITFLQQHAKNQPVYFFSALANAAFPTVEYADARMISHIASLGWVTGITNQLKQPITNQRRQQLLAMQALFMTALINDIQQQKPLFIFIDDSKNKPYLYNISFDYLTYFLRDPRFQRAWQPYVYFTTLTSGDAFQYDVYRRE